MADNMKPLGGTPMSNPEPSLAEDMSLAQWLRSKFRGGALSPTIERAQQRPVEQEIRNALNTNTQRPQQVLPPRGYTERDIMNDIMNSRPRYDANGRRIR
jgi:hypothetical protein